MARLPGAVGLLAASVSCGDPLLSATAFQTPPLAVEGYLQPFPVADLTSPRVTVVWVDPVGMLPDVPAQAEAIHFTLDAAGAFQLQLFAPPPPAAAVGTFRTNQGSEVQYAFGELVLFDDLDGDGSLAISSADDQIVGPDDYRGASAGYVVVYIDATNAENAAIALPILEEAPGYHLGAVDCDTIGPPLITTADSSKAVVVMQVLPPSSSLPYARTCLQTHPFGGS
jgi:hypothetical protein